MTKNTWIIVGAIFAASVLALAGFLYSRDALYFTGWQPHFSVTALQHPEPSLDRPINFPADFTQEARETYNAKLASAKDALKKDPSNVAAWFDLAIYYRGVGDHEGAVEIWEYVSAMNPKESISLHNIGEYYFHTAKDYQKAESYYMRSMELTPTLAQNYYDLADMYEYVYKQDTSAAEDILKKGIESVEAPQSINFIIRLAQYYADTGDTENARTYYKQALDAATALNNPQLVAHISQVLDRLK